MIPNPNPLIVQQALQVTTTVINDGLATDEKLDVILTQMKRIVPYTTARILLIEADMAHVVHFIGYEPDRGPLQLQFKIQADALLRDVLRQQREVIRGVEQAVTGSQVGLPLWLKDDIIGFLVMDSDEPQAFDYASVKWWAIFAAQISTVLYNTRLYHDEQQQRREAESLREISKLVSSNLNLDELVQRLLKHLKTILPFDTVILLLRDAEMLEVVAQVTSPGQTSRVGQRYEIDRYPVLHQLEQTGLPVTSTDEGADKLFKNWDIIAHLGSWMAVPLRVPQHFLGCLLVEHAALNLYGEPEKQVVHYFANQAALAIHNAQLYEEIRRYAQELEARVEERTAQLQQTYEQLSHSESRYRTLFEATFEAICVHEQGTLLDANPAFEEMFGYKLPEITGTSVLDLVLETHREQVTAHIRTQYQKPYETVVIHRDGTSFPVQILGKPIEYEGRVVRVAALRDLRQRIKLEEQRMQLVLEQERMKLVGGFITQTSHEFRTPLSIITTNTYFLKRTLDDETIHNRLVLINQQVEHINRLVENMAILTRLDSQPQTGDQMVVDLNTVVQLVYQKQMLKPNDREHLIELNIQDDPVQVVGNSTDLHLAVQHLLENALLYTDAGGVITLTANRQQETGIIEVRDTGIGIAADMLPQVFERFFRVDKTGTQRGFGLGLSIAKAIVEYHKGRIEADSTPGEGSTFRIVLPLASFPAYVSGIS